MSDFEGKIALITGASGGIGAAIARLLAERGAIVGLHYNNNVVAARDLQTEIVAAGGDALIVQADLAATSGVEDLTAKLDAQLQARYRCNHYDFLINNAAKGGRQPLEALTPAHFASLLQTNLTSPLFLIQQALTRLRDGGRIINISSIATRSSWPEMIGYAPTKAGLEAITLALAPQLGERGITINSVLPGATATNMNAVGSDPDLAASVARTIALGRVGQPNDIAQVVGFLASDAGRWITGQRIDASGGQRL